MKILKALLILIVVWTILYIICDHRRTKMRQRAQAVQAAQAARAAQEAQKMAKKKKPLPPSTKEDEIFLDSSQDEPPKEDFNPSKQSGGIIGRQRNKVHNAAENHHNQVNDFLEDDK